MKHFEYMRMDLDYEMRFLLHTPVKNFHPKLGEVQAHYNSFAEAGEDGWELCGNPTPSFTFTGQVRAAGGKLEDMVGITAYMAIFKREIE